LIRLPLENYKNNIKKELEALKLYEVDGMDQKQGAEKMKISQPTFARILDSGIKKMT